MENGMYKVTRIEGEYAYITSVGDEKCEEVFIAMALLPLGTDIGTVLNFEFSLIS